MVRGGPGQAKQRDFWRNPVPPRRQEMPQPGQLQLPPGHPAEHLLTLWANRNMGEKSDDSDFKLQAFRVILQTSVVTGAEGIPNVGQSKSSYTDWPLSGMRFVGKVVSQRECLTVMRTQEKLLY